VKCLICAQKLAIRQLLSDADETIKQPMPRTSNLAPCHIAGCCHLANLMAWFCSYYLSILKVLWRFFPQA